MAENNLELTRFVQHDSAERAGVEFRFQKTRDGKTAK